MQINTQRCNSIFSDCDEKLWFNMKPAAIIHAMSFLHGTKSLYALRVRLGQLEHAFYQNKGKKHGTKHPTGECYGLVEHC